MKSKKWLFGLLGIVMSLGLAAAYTKDIQAEGEIEYTRYPVGTYVICNGEGELFAVPDHTTEIIAKIPDGSTALILEEGPNFAKVSCDGLTGYLWWGFIHYDESIHFANQIQQLTSEDVRMMAAMIQCEAGWEEYAGQVAVGAVIMNRVKSDIYPNTVSEVLYQTGQFGPAKSKKFAELLANDTIMDSCRQAAAEAFLGVDNVGGALHFRRVGSKEGIVIGNHVFY